MIWFHEDGGSVGEKDLGIFEAEMVLLQLLQTLHSIMPSGIQLCGSLLSLGGILL